MSTSAAANQNELMFNELELGWHGCSHDLPDVGRKFFHYKDDFRLLRFAHFMLELDGDTVVRKNLHVALTVSTVNPFQFVEFDSLKPTNNKYLINVVGYVTNIGRTTQQKSGSKTLDFHLANSRRQSVRVDALGDIPRLAR
ncbi:hypothetical protein Tco_0974823 [Tanacetum coccineum]|uniref:Uncharacterized protein n=1 Tax=Tanacetum coccineum TaxID=301880 RepID=A0ABQ5ECT0_9ASTR